MNKINEFARSEMTEEQETLYIESLYNVHYNNKLRLRYSAKLEEEYNVSKSNFQKTGVNKPKYAKLRNLIIGVSSIAAILVFVLFALPMFKSGTEITPQQMATNLIEIERIEVERGAVDNAQVRMDIINAYNAKDWLKTIDLYAGAKVMNDTDYYHLGLAHMAMDNYLDAEVAFDKIVSPETFKYSVEYNWYRGLNKVILNKQEEAKDYLNKVVLSSWMSENAQTLLDEMK